MKDMKKQMLVKIMVAGILVKHLLMQIKMVNGMNLENLKNFLLISKMFLKSRGWLLITVLELIWFITILKYGQIH